ncbi:DMT family transporter [Nocardioides aurantiacus]|uniref:DME family drug/metabolite transporter n=1 Tax=Nocardioides aurantiacus TaxID=86796 RepID=A0A3N2CNV4_9ACTN|nr:DMT family transporter [Nocardioides aurantiacus]ROR89207.1 DME family drug/metabolite transporter [Nocardioides aurantiacus]
MSTREVPGSGSLWRGLALVSLAGVVWGTIGPGAQVLHDRSGLGSLTVTAYRAVAAVAVLGLVVGLTGRLATVVRAARAEWGRVVVVGVLTAAFQALFFVAVALAGVCVVTVVCLGFAPVLLLAVDGVRDRRLPSGGRAVSVVVAVVGLLLVTFAGGAGENAPGPGPGILLALAAGAAYALSTDVAAPLSQDLDTLTITTATVGVAAAVLVPLGLVATAVRGDPFTTSDATSWWLIAYLGVFTLAIAYALLFTGLRTTPSGAAVVATLLEPVTAVLIAVLLLGEHLTAAGVVGSLLIVLAIAGIGRASEPPTPQ